MDIFYLCPFLGSEDGEPLNGFLTCIDISVELQRVFGIFLCLCRVLIFLDAFCNARLSVKQTRTLQLDEEVLCVSYSPNQKLLAVSLLDCTVKIFYVDTLKVQWLCLWIFAFFLTDLGLRL